MSQVNHASWVVYYSGSGGEALACELNAVTAGERPESAKVDSWDHYASNVYCRDVGAAIPEGKKAWEYTVDREGIVLNQENMAQACRVNTVVDGTRPDNYEHQVAHWADRDRLICWGYGDAPRPPTPDVPEAPEHEWGSGITQGIFDLSVTIAGEEVRGITLAGATITVGSTSPTGLPPASTAFLELISYDAAGDIVADYPKLTFGDGIPSGFIDVYSDTYEGTATLLEVGAPVVVNARSASGFIDEYVDDYDTGLDSTRFTGKITAIDVTPARVGITAVAATEALTRQLLDPSGWPAENEFSRLDRICQAAEVSMWTDATETFATMIARDAAEELESVWSLLGEVTDAAGGLVYADRYGKLQYRGRDQLPETLYVADPDATLIDGLMMSEELGEVFNELEVSWGDSQTFILEDADSREKYGPRARKITIPVSVESEARALAQEELNDHALPYWSLSSATVMVSLADPQMMGELLTADLDDAVELPALLPAFPMPNYSSRVTGYTETLDPYEWRLDLSLDPTGMTRSNT